MLVPSFDTAERVCEAGRVSNIFYGIRCLRRIAKDREINIRSSWTIRFSY